MAKAAFDKIKAGLDDASRYFDARGRDVNDYDALRDYLKKQTLPEFVLSFEQIEEIIDGRVAPRCAGAPGGVGRRREPPPRRKRCRSGEYARRRLHRDPAGGRQERAVQADEVGIW